MTTLQFLNLSVFARSWIANFYCILSSFNSAHMINNDIGIDIDIHKSVSFIDSPSLVIEIFECNPSAHNKRSASTLPFLHARLLTTWNYSHLHSDLDRWCCCTFQTDCIITEAFILVLVFRSRKASLYPMLLVTSDSSYWPSWAAFMVWCRRPTCGCGYNTSVGIHAMDRAPYLACKSLCNTIL